MRELGLSLMFSLSRVPLYIYSAPSSSQAALTPPLPRVAACFLLQLCYTTVWFYFLCHTHSFRQILICFAFVLSPCLSAWNISSGEVGACLSYL